MKLLGTFFCSFVLCLSTATASVWQTVSPEFATLTAAILTAIPDTPKPELLRVSLGYGDRRSKVDVTTDFQARGYFVANPNAPVIYIIPGLGGNEYSGASSFLASYVNRLGYHAITLPSALSWQFSVRASRTSTVGYLPEDMKDMVRAIRAIESRLAPRFNVKKRSAIGYSLGALALAHLANAADRAGMTFEQFVMINPPLDLEFGIKKVEQYSRYGDQFSGSEKSRLKGYIMSEAQKILDQGLTLEQILERESTFKLSKASMRYLVGNSFDESLWEVIQTSQRIEPLGVMKTKLGCCNRGAFDAETRTYSFMQYLDLFLRKSIEKNFGIRDTLKSLIRAVSLDEKRTELVKDKRFYLFHNSDDFLVEGSYSSTQLKGFLPGRSMIRDYGGHVGNLWDPLFLNQLAKVLQ